MQDVALAGRKLREFEGSAGVRATLDMTRRFLASPALSAVARAAQQIQTAPALSAVARAAQQIQAHQGLWADRASIFSRMFDQIQIHTVPEMTAVARAASGGHGPVAAPQLAEHLVEELLTGQPTLAPRRKLSDAELVQLRRASLFIAVGIVALLAMELAPEAAVRFGIWLGLTWGATSLLLSVTDSTDR